MFEETIKKVIESSLEVKREILQSDALILTISKVVSEIISTYKEGGKVLLCGNGGSAADAQHIAAELSGKFYLDRPSLFAEALHTNVSYITAVSNDYSFEEVYSRLVKAEGNKGDLLIGISTSGNSKNIIKALEAANEIGMITVGMTGASGGKMKNLCRYLINVPSTDMPRIQESHILIGHIICEIVEKELFGSD